MTFSHSGDTGDLIYALPTVIMHGGGRLRLVQSQGHPVVREPFSPAKVEALRPLLEAQPYISGVEFGTAPTGVNLDVFRDQYRFDINLCEMISNAFGLLPYPPDAPWLFCSDPQRVARVVISRSPRYPGFHFPWRRVAEKYRRDAVFVGLPDEHAAWRDAYGPIPFFPTSNWWDLARAIAGAQIFCGNQSAPMAIALGLAVPWIVQEVCPYVPNCLFDRRGTVYGLGEHVELPD